MQRHAREDRHLVELAHEWRVGIAAGEERGPAGRGDELSRHVLEHTPANEGPGGGAAHGAPLGRLMPSRSVAAVDAAVIGERCGTHNYTIAYCGPVRKESHLI